MLSAAELLVLAALVVALYTALRPPRRWLERRIARLLRPRARGDVIVLERRADGRFEGKEHHE